MKPSGAVWARRGRGATLRSAACACCDVCCALPWLTLACVVAGAAGIGLFDSHTRDALDAANEAANIISGSGLHDATVIAKRCVTAATTARCAACAAAAAALRSKAALTPRNPRARHRFSA